MPFRDTTGPTEKGSVMTIERVRLNKQSRFNPIRNLTPENLVKMIDAFHAGNLREFALMMDAIERRDDVLQCVAPKRKKAVARREWEVLTISDLPEGKEEEAELHQQILTDFYNNVEVTNAVDQNQRGGFPLLVRQMLDAIGKGYAVHEILWKFTADGVRAVLQFVPLQFFENRTGRLRFLTTDGASEGVELEEGQWMVTVGDGIMEACSVAYMFKRLPMQDWLHYCDKHGTPGIQGKTDAKKGDERWNAMVEALGAMSQSFTCVTSLTDVIEKIDLSTQGELPYPPMVERMDRALAALWRGADLSTMSAGMGQGQGASLQGEETHLLETDDAALVSETLQMYLDRRVIEFVLGPGVEPLAYVEVIVPPEQDVERDIKIDSFLLGKGFPITRAAAAERYGRPLPEGTDEEELLQEPKPEPTIEGANERAGEESEEELVEKSLADALGVRKRWLAPVKPFLSELIIALQDPSKSDAAVLEFLEKAAKRVPELLGSMDRSALADSIEAALGTAAVTGVRDQIREVGK